jgi:hypothetical protein
MAGIIFEVFAKICPSTTYANHDTFTLLTNAADEELDWGLAS